MLIAIHDSELEMCISMFSVIGAFLAAPVPPMKWLLNDSSLKAVVCAHTSNIATLRTNFCLATLAFIPRTGDMN